MNALKEVVNGIEHEGEALVQNIKGGTHHLTCHLDEKKLYEVVYGNELQDKAII